MEGLRLEGVTKRWGAFLDNIDLDDWAAGTVTGVAGDNGTGKTTLLRIACGMVIPERGSVRFRGIDIERERASYQRAIGLLSAGDRGLYARLTVRQNLAFWSGLAGLSRRASRAPDRRGAVRVRPRGTRAAPGRPALDGPAPACPARRDVPPRAADRIPGRAQDEPRRDGRFASRRGVGPARRRGGAALWVSHQPDEPLVTDLWRLSAGRLQRVDRTGAESEADVPPVLAS